MSRVKILIFVLVLVPIIIVGAVLILLANPEYYRDQLRSTVLEQTGYELNIKGEMKWRYWPPIALSISDIVVTPKGKTEPLATLKAAAMDLSLLPLLFGSQEISVKGIDVDGLTVNAIVDENGMANWVVEMEAAPGDDSSATKPDSGEGFSLDIGGINVTNTIINYQDHATKTDYTVEIARIETGPVRYDVPVAIAIELSIADNTAGMMIDATAGGTITFDANFNRIHFDKLKVSQSITMPDMVPLTLSATLDGMFDTVVSKL
ncbi:MAG: AsmA family protein, partial [Pseudomonadales bacterium]